MTWTPTLSDIAWCQSLMDVIIDGGVWVTDNGAYKVDHKQKRLTLIEKPPWHDRGDHERNRICFGAIGWTVEEET